jgi:ketosteroid isomerase-like protein
MAEPMKASGIGAAFVPEPGRAVSGRESIRTELEQIVTMKPRMSGSVEKVLQAGDTALVAYRWNLEGTGPDGAPIRMNGLSADVLRRRPDGSWGVIIDDPYGVVGAADAGDPRGA